MKHYEENPSLYSDVELAGINYHNNFVVSGKIQALRVLKQFLDEQSIISLLLPVQHSFHSQAIDPIEEEFKAFVSELSINDAAIPCYSCASGGRLEAIDGQYWWDVIRRPVHFSSLVSEVHSKSPYTYVDLSPTGTLSSFLKHGFSDQLNHYVTVNQFGKNLQTVSKLVEALA
jgi:acyl transferase domain-containing protein